jgi:FtsZ-interacting cell division protein YlmF
MSGITLPLQGKITPISAKTYFISPENVDLLGAQPDGAETDGQYL